MITKELLQQTYDKAVAQKYAAEGAMQTIEYLLSVFDAKTEQELQEDIARGNKQGE